MGAIQIMAGVVMIWAAARIANIHPIFRYGVIRGPQWAYALMKRYTGSTLGPSIVGFLTVFMPCGVTQAMMTVAVASGNPFTGAAIMGAFVLGTSPLFFVIGASFAQLIARPVFRFVAVAVVLFFAILSLNGGMVLRGSFYTLQNFWIAAGMSPEELVSLGGTLAPVNAQGKQEVVLQVMSQGYRSSANVLKAGVPVQISLTTDNTQGCTRTFTIPEMNLVKPLEATGMEIIEFTPRKTGRLAYSCGMGMYTGTFMVIN
jgi:hypothetical protein